MRTLGPEATAESLPYSRLVEGIRATLLRRSEDRVVAPERVQLPLANSARLLVMPASDDTLAITKLVTVHPNNARYGKPTIQGEVIAIRASDGERLATLDGATVTSRRTAAVSALAAMSLEPEIRGPMLVIGAGTQARAHVEAFRELFGIDTVYVHSRTRQSSEALTAHARRLGMSANSVSDLTSALSLVNVIVTATTSTEPILKLGSASGPLMLAVGAFRPDMAEVSAEVIAACDIVVVDDLDGARSEAGDLIRAERQGSWSFDEAITLTDILNRQSVAPGQKLFKSVGSSLFDLAACHVALGI